MNVPPQISPHYARSQSVHRDSAALQPTGQLTGEQQVGQLAATVRRGLVVALLTVQVLKVNVTAFVEFGGDDHDATGGRPFQQVQQQVGEQEVSQVVHPKLHLEAILRFGVRTLVDTCIVDQHV